MLKLGRDDGTLTIRFRPGLRPSDEAFWRLCRANPDLDLERSARGELVIAAPSVHRQRRPARLADRSAIKSRTVEIYRPDRDVEILTKPESLSGEDVLPGLVVDLRGILFH